MKTVAVATLGCKVNQFESEALMTSLEEKGYGLVPFEEGADIAIINTCTVTQRADFQSRQMVRRALRRNPRSLVIVTGCSSQADPEGMTKIEGVRAWLGNGEKNKIPDLLPAIEEAEAPWVRVNDIRAEKTLPDVPLPSFHHHTRAFLKIQDGCNARCSYCIVPYARGPSRSLPPEKVIGHLKALRARGFREVVLTGVHTGAYGRDLANPSSIEDLLEQIETEEVPERIRLSSIEPADFSPGLISILSKSRKLCPHLHIPIQSGEDEILKGMARDYDRAFLLQLIHELHERIPDVSIGADLIVGFPGETEEKFSRTLSLVRSSPLSYLHVFPFSKRRGTPASTFLNQVNEGTIKERAEILRSLGQEKRKAFYNGLLQRSHAVLIEGRRGGATGPWRGFSRNYVPVFLEESPDSDRDLKNEELNLKITAFTEGGVVGRVLER